MQPMFYIGLDVHKREVSYCVKEHESGASADAAGHAAAKMKKRPHRRGQDL